MTRPAVLALVLAGCGSEAAVAPDGRPGLAGVTEVPLAGCAWAFTGTFDLGGSPFRLLVDTGSDALAVAGADCPDCQAAGAMNVFTPGSTTVDRHMPVQVVYGDGNRGWSGVLLQDDVSVGEAHGRVDFASISKQTSFFGGTPCGTHDGIAGIAGTGATSMMSAFAATGTDDVFAMHTCAPTGTLWIGGYDPAAAVAAPAYVPMTVANTSYTVDVTGFAVGGVGIDVPSSAFGPAIVDSGGPKLIVPPVAYDAITAAIAADPTFAAVFGTASWFSRANSCITTAMTKAELDAKLPALTVRIGVVDVAMAATDSYIEVYPLPSGRLYCPALYPAEGFLDLGNSVIRSQLTIFDRAQHRMGFAATPACN